MPGPSNTASLSANALLERHPDARRRVSHSPAQAAEAVLRSVAALTMDAALEQQASSLPGLTLAQVEERRKKYGTNTIASRTRLQGWRRFLTLLASPLSLLLLLLTCVNLAIGETWGGAMIGIMVILSTLLSFLQEHRADKAAQQLRSMVATTATVQRADQGKLEIPLAELVPGDIIFLSAGDIAPADVRILSAKMLFISQAALTGESLPVEKTSAASMPSTTTSGENLTDIPNLAFMGTNVVSGTGTALVVATAGRTAFGHIAVDLIKARELTSFDRGIDKYVHLLMRVMLVMVPLVFLLNGITKETGWRRCCSLSPSPLDSRRRCFP